MSREFAGTEQYLAGLAKAQAGQGHQVHLLLKEQSTETKTRWLQECGPAVTFHFMPAGIPKRLAGFWSFNLARKHRPQVCHTHLGRAARYMGRGCQWARVPMVATLHLRYRPKDAAHANKLIAIASWQLEDMPEDQRRKTTVIWNWASEPAAEVQNPTVSSSRKRGSMEQSPAQQSIIHFLSVGRLVPQKGMDILIAAFQQAFPNHTDVKLTLVGEGPERPNLQTIAGGDERITFAGYQRSVAPFYAQATAFVSAARYEPFGLVLLEAMQHGLPLISTDSEGPSEFLADYPVLWARKADINSLSTALSTAYQQAMEAGLPRQTYDMSPFDLQNALQKIETVYKSLK